LNPSGRASNSDPGKPACPAQIEVWSPGLTLRRPHLASDLIREAVAITLSYTLETESWGGEIPELGMITFIDARKVRRQGRNREPGFVYQKAGFRHVGYTKAGLWAYQMLPAEMPDPAPVPESVVRSQP
jgi:hypothetical protein